MSKRERDRWGSQEDRDAEANARWIGVVAILIVLALMASSLTGCAAAPGLYVRAGIGPQDDTNTDFWEQTDRDWQCENPAFRAEAGWESKQYVFMEIPVRYGASYWHDSWLRCGTGFNERPESYANGWLGWVKAGGR